LLRKNLTTVGYPDNTVGYPQKAYIPNGKHNKTYPHQGYVFEVAPKH